MEDNKRRDYAGTPPPAAMESTTMASEQTTSSRRRLKRKSASVNTSGGSSASQTTSSKRQAREKPPPVPINMNGPCTRARVQPNNNNYYRGEDEAVGVQVKSEAEAKARGEAEEMMKMSRARENWEALEAKIEAEYDVMIRSRGSTVHVVPVHAGWFSWTKIHPVEEMMLPSFFSGKSESRTPEIYMETRNWIMKKFHHDPNTQIELKHLSELTLGEPDGRQEVMEFLDYWGLINYHPTPDNKPAAMAVDGDANSDEAGKTDDLVEKLFKFETVQSCTPVLLRMNMAMPAVSSGLFPESVAADELVKSEGPAVEYHCNSCSADCSRKRYHCQKQADFDLCADCFNNGKFGSNMSPSDFILMEPAEAGGATGGNWTDQETLLLLEAIELFRDNWSEIAEHVATKTKAQCILHFIEMPIEDAFFNQDYENNAAPKENGLPVSSSTENPAPKADEDGDALEDVPEKIENESDKSDNQEKKDDETGDQETKGDKTDDQDSSCPMEISKPDEVNESDKSPEVNESFALKALKEAFEAVGSLPSAGEKFSFAEAGNPVMTLAAFLVRLVDPNTATASVRSILKCLSGNYSGEQLAARHSFRLEDPPDDKKNLADSDGAATEAIEHDAQNDKDEHIKKQNEETPGSVADGCSLRNDEGDKRKDHDEKKDSAAEDQKPVASTSGDHADRSDTVKEADTMATEETRMASTNEPSNSELEKAPKDTEESVVLTSQTELHTNSVKESEDGASVMEPLQSKGTLKIEDTISIPEKENGLLVTFISEKETGDGEGKGCDGEKKEHPLTHNDLDVDKLKRAAVTALSAAAVKAKLLADQEEDQILQLSTFLVERQLYKLETKFAFFNDMENVVMRVKEQLDRSKQRLFQERAHIIATRFGMLGQGRPNSQMLPPNKAGVNFPNSGPRPFMGTNSLRPPFARPIMTTNSAASTFTPPSASGNAMQANIDKFSSAGMK